MRKLLEKADSHLEKIFINHLQKQMFKKSYTLFTVARQRLKKANKVRIYIESNVTTIKALYILCVGLHPSVTECAIE